MVHSNHLIRTLASSSGWSKPRWIGQKRVVRESCGNGSTVEEGMAGWSGRQRRSTLRWKVLAVSRPWRARFIYPSSSKTGCAGNLRLSMTDVYACIPEALVKLRGSKTLTIEYMKNVEQESIRNCPWKTVTTTARAIQWMACDWTDSSEPSWNFREPPCLRSCLTWSKALFRS